jgi:16S rRNA (cytosine967-C5)-methyltransferase
MKHPDSFIEDFFLKNPLNMSLQDEKLTKEIAFGVVKRNISLNYLIDKLGAKKLSNDGKIIFKIALYQYVFLDKIPLYAIVDTSVELAKIFLSPKVAGFFNAFLRRLNKDMVLLPHDRLDIFYSYPQFYVDALLQEYGKEKTKEILDVQNHFPSIMFRVREKDFLPSFAIAFYENKIDIRILPKDVCVPIELFESPSVYIQNFTPAYLVEQLFNDIKAKENIKILDLCASPGGKLILAHDLFSKKELFANDISEKKMVLLRNNLSKYGIEAKLSKYDALNFQSDTKFDIIIVDAPCSNSGVLHKRAEARLRLNAQNLKRHQQLQIDILKHAQNLLKPHGQIWYLTCSILKEENEDVVSHFNHGKFYKVLPDAEGRDGGFACAIFPKRGVFFSTRASYILQKHS